MFADRPYILTIALGRMKAALLEYRLAHKVHVSDTVLSEQTHQKDEL
jgi:hypothetical protein